jgi:hypothetical protein
MTLMLHLGTVSQPHLTSLDLDERLYNVSVQISHDGVEFQGRLWFADDEWEDAGMPDRGVLPGRSEDEVLGLAQRLNQDELTQRFRRAVAEKRRFHGLRTITGEVLSKIRYLNQVAISMRSGFLDVEAAAQEIDMTEVQLHELVSRLRTLAGVEE